MDRSIRRMECSDVVKVIRDCTHLHHAVPIIRCQALDLGAPVVDLATRSHDCLLGCLLNLPVLEPHLYLPGAETRDLAREPLSVRCVRMGLLGKFAHQKTGLLVREPRHPSC